MPATGRRPRRVDGGTVSTSARKANILRRRTVRRRWWLGVGALATLAVAAGLAAVGTGSQDDSEPPPAGADAGLGDLSSAGARVGDAVPELAVETIEGDEFAIPTGRPTAVFFTASYCASCLPKAEALGRIHDEVGDRITVLGVDIDPLDSVPAFRKWIELAGSPRFDFAMDADGRLVNGFGVFALSTVVIVDADGEIVYRTSGEGGEADFREAFALAGLQ